MTTFHVVHQPCCSDQATSACKKVTVHIYITEIELYITETELMQTCCVSTTTMRWQGLQAVSLRTGPAGLHALVSINFVMVEPCHMIHAQKQHLAFWQGRERNMVNEWLITGS